MTNTAHAQQQMPPGLTALMDPVPDHGEESYVGSGRLEGKKADITGADEALDMSGGSYPVTGGDPLHATPMAQFTCLGCGYGACCRIAPERCPMCGGSTWEHVDPSSPDDTTRRV